MTRSKNKLTINTEPGQPFINGAREFDAPVAAVWRAHTEPELLAKWMAPRDITIEDMRFEPRVGGTYGFINREQDGTPYRFHGVVHSIEPEKSITQTFEFEGVPGHVSLEKSVFEDLGNGRTRVSFHSAFQSVEDRDGMIASGMEGGMVEAYEQLDELLPTL